MIAAIHGILEQSSFDPDAIAVRDRILADGGTVVNMNYMNRFILKCKELNIWATLHSAPDPNFGIKTASSQVSKVYCLKGRDYGQDVSLGLPNYTANGSGNKSVLRVDGAQGLSSLANIDISGNVSRHFINIFNQTGPASNKNIAGYGVSTNGALWDILLFNNTVIWHGNGAGFDTIGNAPGYTTDRFNVFEIAYDGAAMKSSINGSARFSKTQPTALATSNTRLRTGAGVHATYPPVAGSVIPSFVWNTPIPVTELSQFITFLKTEYSIS